MEAASVAMWDISSGKLVEVQGTELCIRVDFLGDDERYLAERTGGFTDGWAEKYKRAGLVDKVRDLEAGTWAVVRQGVSNMWWLMERRK